MANVLTTTAINESTGISVYGTAEDGVLAVSCSLQDSDGVELDFISVEVSNNKYTASFTSNDSATSVACANYDGGSIVTADIEEETSGETEETTTEETATPSTGAMTAETGSATSSFPFALVGAGVLAVATFATVLALRRRNKSNG